MLIPIGVGQGTFLVWGIAEVVWMGDLGRFGDGSVPGPCQLSSSRVRLGVVAVRVQTECKSSVRDLESGWCARVGEEPLRELVKVKVEVEVEVEVEVCLGVHAYRSNGRRCCRESEVVEDFL